MARARPEATALLHGAGRLSFAELDAAVDASVALLNACALPQGAVVAVLHAPGPELIVLLLALMKSGRVALPMNPRFPDAYVADILADTGCGITITDTARVLPSGVQRHALSDLVRWDTSPTLPVIDDFDEHRAAVLVLTSGSTARPKAAALSLGNLCAAAESANRNIPLEPGDGWLLSLPLFHVAGLGVLFRCLLAGAAVVLPEAGQPMTDALAPPEVTHASLVATQLYRLLREPGGPELLRGKRALLCGGSAFPPALLDDAAAAELPLHLSFGMTETAAQISATRQGEGRDAWNTAGHPLVPGAVRLDTSGEIAVRGPSVFLGYWQAGALRPAPMDDGWFYTGDLGAWDAAGRLLVLGRKGNAFNVGGENVQPEEVERALLSLPGVLRARVVALPDPEYVQVPVAFVDAPGAAHLDDALRLLLPPHARPRHLLPWPHHLEREGEKLSRAALEAEAVRCVNEQVPQIQ